MIQDVLTKIINSRKYILHEQVNLRKTDFLGAIFRSEEN